MNIEKRKINNSDYAISRDGTDIGEVFKKFNGNTIEWAAKYNPIKKEDVFEKLKDAVSFIEESDKAAKPTLLLLAEAKEYAKEIKESKRLLGDDLKRAESLSDLFVKKLGYTIKKDISACDRIPCHYMYIRDNEGYPISVTNREGVKSNAVNHFYNKTEGIETMLSLAVLDFERQQNVSLVPTVGSTGEIEREHDSTFKNENKKSSLAHSLLVEMKNLTIEIKKTPFSLEDKIDDVEKYIKMLGYSLVNTHETRGRGEYEARLFDSEGKRIAWDTDGRSKMIPLGAMLETAIMVYTEDFGIDMKDTRVTEKNKKEYIGKLADAQIYANTVINGSFYLDGDVRKECLSKLYMFAEDIGYTLDYSARGDMESGKYFSADFSYEGNRLGGSCPYSLTSGLADFFKEIVGDACKRFDIERLDVNREIHSKMSNEIPSILTEEEEVLTVKGNQI